MDIYTVSVTSDVCTIKRSIQQVSDAMNVEKSICQRGAEHAGEKVGPSETKKNRSHKQRYHAGNEEIVVAALAEAGTPARSAGR
jgi:hypothetical protein